MADRNSSQQSGSRFNRTLAQGNVPGASVPSDGTTQRRPYAAHANSQANPYIQQSAGAQRGYTAPANNPYVSGPTSGAVGFNAEQVKSSHGKRFKQTSAGQGMPGMPGTPRKRKRKAPIIAAILLVLAAIGGVAAWFVIAPPIYNVTINGTERLVKSGTTLQEALDENYATPTAGDLLAIDGTVCVEGGGNAFEATINGQATNDANAEMPRNAVVEITDGNDVTEEYTETTEAIPHGSSGDDYTSFDLYWAGSIHQYSDGEDGEQIVKTGAVSGVTLTEVTKQPVDEGYSVYTTYTGDDKVIALTFDDGPWPDTTAEILDILAENDAKATFFEIGNQCAEYADIVKRIASEGHQIATHTYDHASGSGGGVDLTKMTSEQQLTEVQKGFEAIEDVLGTSVTHIMRAPGGNYHGSIITTLKDEIVAEIGWDVDTEDWAKPGVESIKNAILSAKSGQVVLMHDGGGDRSQTVEALRQALPELKAEGYSFITIDELMAYGKPAQ